MKLIITLILISTSALAGNIPLEIFDQSKLETIVRRIPSALIKTENLEGFVRKHYLFNSDNEAAFSLKCHADYFRSALIPTNKVCAVEVPGLPEIGDEYLLKTKNTKTVRELFNALSFSPEVKKSFSNERIYGQAHDGKYKNLFHTQSSARWTPASSLSRLKLQLFNISFTP